MVSLRIFRFDPANDKQPRFESYTFPERPGMTVLEGLIHVQENLDASLAFRSSCRSALCGSCAMHIGGKYGLACQTQIANVASGGSITIRPLNHLRVVRDLVVDLKKFFAQWRKIRPYLVAKTTGDKRGFSQSPEQRRRLDTIVDCIMCGSCYAACPSANQNADYLGPHALLRALRWVEDSRDEAQAERLAMVADENGIYRCHLVFNCQTVCPKKLDPAAAIMRLKQHVTVEKLSLSEPVADQA
jgi:succinate dehydrogenase / fumarate reductase, iron-sulfur subunit